MPAPPLPPAHLGAPQAPGTQHPLPPALRALCLDTSREALPSTSASPAAGEKKPLSLSAQAGWAGAARVGGRRGLLGCRQHTTASLGCLPRCVDIVITY